MQLLIEYVRGLRKFPSGDAGAISATQKLALIYIISAKSGEEIEIAPERLAADLSLSGEKSVYKILSKLEEGGLLRLTSRTNERGHRLPPLAFPLPRLRRAPGIPEDTGENPSILQDTTTGPSIPEDTTFEAPSIPEDTRQNPSIPEDTGLKPYDKRTSTRPSISQDTRGSGTELASFSLSVNSKQDKEKEKSGPSIPEDTRDKFAPVDLWGKITGLQVTPGIAGFILPNIKDLEVWEKTLRGWIASNWKASNVAGQVAAYEKAIIDKATGKPGAQPETKREVSKEDKNLIYG